MAGSAHELTSRVDDKRIDSILEMVMTLASGELSYRLNTSAGGDDVDAIILGLNMLAEELESIHHELEQRVDARTRELRRVNEMLRAESEERLRAQEAMRRETTMVHLLQAAGTVANESAALDEALGTLVRRVCGIIGWPVGHAVMVADEDAHRSIWHFEEPGRHQPFRNFVDGLVTAGTSPLPVVLLAAKIPIWIPDLTNERPDGVTIPRDAGIVSGFGFPVLVEDKAVAILEFFTDRRVEPDQRLLEVATSMSEQLERILERRRARDELAQRALYDSLTGLPNRGLFRDRVTHARAGAERRRESIALLMIDLDGFKNVNDTLGHAAGDRMLIEMARRIESVLRPTDTPARLGGDEFAVLLAGTDRAGAEAAARRVMGAIKEPIDIEGREILPSASIGISLWVEGQDVDDLLRNADAAMYSVKRARTGTFEVYDECAHARVLDRLALGADLRAAVRRLDFTLVYQPIVETATGRPVGIEALVRWMHPERGMISPATFVPLAEETGLIVPLGRWVIATACRQAKLWQDSLPTDTPLRISVNLSPRQLRDASLADDVGAILMETALPPSSLTLEITETAVVADLEEAIGRLAQLRELGMRLAIDDFGTGYSSLSYLRKLPVDEVKIDRTFITGIANAAEEWSVAVSIVRLLNALEMETVAEGVEEAAQLAHLRALGCTFIQGFYIAKPAAAAETEAFLRSALVDHPR